MEVVRKSIKNLHLGVYPPEGRVRVAVPLWIDNGAVRLAVISKLGWIKRQQARFVDQLRQPKREMRTGESHYYQGRRYRLRVAEQTSGANGMTLHGTSEMELRVRKGSDAKRRKVVLDEWYRCRIKERVPELIVKWEPVIGVKVAEWGIKRMRTRWGTCNIGARRIWLNLALIKESPQCLEYVLVHEMIHLLEQHHNGCFRKYMDQFMPQWHLYQDELNRSPLGHEE